MPYPERSGKPAGKDPNELGALWEKQGKNGQPYYTGEIAGQRVVVFPVNKKHERSPALRVLKATEQPGGGSFSGSPAAARPTRDDIPF